MTSRFHAKHISKIVATRTVNSLSLVLPSSVRSSSNSNCAFRSTILGKPFASSAAWQFGHFAVKVLTEPLRRREPIEHARMCGRGEYERRDNDDRVEAVAATARSVRCDR